MFKNSNFILKTLTVKHLKSLADIGFKIPTVTLKTDSVVSGYDAHLIQQLFRVVCPMQLPGATANAKPRPSYGYS